MEQECIAMEKQNSITNKFQKKRYNIYNNNLLLKTCETTFVMNYFHCWCGTVLGLFPHQQ